MTRQKKLLLVVGVSVMAVGLGTAVHGIVHSVRARVASRRAQEVRDGLRAHLGAAEPEQTRPEAEREGAHVAAAALLALHDPDWRVMQDALLAARFGVPLPPDHMEALAGYWDGQEALRALLQRSPETMPVFPPSLISPDSETHPASVLLNAAYPLNRRILSLATLREHQGDRESAASLLRYALLQTHAYGKAGDDALFALGYAGNLNRTAEHIEGILSRCALSETALRDLQAALALADVEGCLRDVLTKKARRRMESEGVAAELPGRRDASSAARAANKLQALKEVLDALADGPGGDGGRVGHIPTDAQAPHRTGFREGLDELVGLAVRAEAVVTVTRVGLAVERYRLSSGNWPESLEDLVPDYLTAVPSDPGTSEPLSYIDGDGWRVVYAGEKSAEPWPRELDSFRLTARRRGACFALLSPDLRGKPGD
ncbi:MAG: hypothetical protein ACOC7S_02885 [Planctomycetota bacterium]